MNKLPLALALTLSASITRAQTMPVRLPVIHGPAGLPAPRMPAVIPPASFNNGLIVAPALAPALALQPALSLQGALPLGVRRLPPAAAAEALPTPVAARPVADGRMFDRLKVYSTRGGGGEALALIFGDERDTKRVEVRYDAAENFGSGRLSIAGAESAQLSRPALLSLRRNLRSAVASLKKDDRVFSDSRVKEAMLKFAGDQARIAAVSKDAVVAKVADAPMALKNELVITFAPGTSMAQARELIEQHQTTNGLAWGPGLTNHFLPLPQGGFIVVLKERAASREDKVGAAWAREHAALAAYGMARDPRVKGIKLGAGVKKSFDRMVK